MSLFDTLLFDTIRHICFSLISFRFVSSSVVSLNTLNALGARNETTCANRSFAPSPGGRQCLGAERGMLTGLIVCSIGCNIKAHVVSVYNLQNMLLE